MRETVADSKDLRSCHTKKIVPTPISAVDTKVRYTLYSFLVDKVKQKWDPLPAE